MSDDEIMTHFGWDIVCESPLEVSDNEGSFASGFAAQITIDYFKNEYEIEQREKIIAESEDIKHKYIIKEITLNEYFKQIQELRDKLLKDSKK